MIKKVVFLFMVMFSLSLVSPMVAENATKEPQKQENCQKAKAECPEAKKAECDKAKKADCDKKEQKPCCSKKE